MGEHIFHLELDRFGHGKDLMSTLYPFKASQVYVCVEFGQDEDVLSFDGVERFGVSDLISVPLQLAKERGL